jgi:hypothetical protein
MNLTFSTKLCIVACHSDTPFKKNIIHHNDPLLKKIAHTIYINSSKYGKTIPMIHTNKLDKYDKYNHVLSTVNLQQYNLIIWMTDETLLTFSLMPFMHIAFQRGYHEYKDIIFQTPHYYLHPYPLVTIYIPPTIDEPSLFKSPILLQPISTVSNEPFVPVDQFVLDGKFIPSTNVEIIFNETSTHSKPNENSLPKSYTLSTTIKSISTISTHSYVAPVSRKIMLSKTMVSFTNILFKSNPVKEKEKKKEKEKEKETWFNQLIRLRDYPLPSCMDSIYETILIAFQPLPYLEYLLRKMILHFPSWSHTVVCGNLNTDLIASWNLPLHVISLDIDMINAEQYNELVLMPSFWELFQGETLLVYQEDSMPITYNIEPHHMYKVVEPGITIRNKAYILNYLTINPPEEGISEQLYFQQYAI